MNGSFVLADVRVPEGASASSNRRGSGRNSQKLPPNLVGSCLATGDRISCDTCNRIPTRAPTHSYCKQKLHYISQPQSITQKGVHARPLTAREREHWFLQHLSIFQPRISGVNSANTLLCDTLALSHIVYAEKLST